MLSARFRFEARILAGSAEASQTARTVGIHLTLVGVTNRNLLAGKAGISRVSRRASTRRPVVVHSALGTRCTIARISALFVLARQMVRTLVVPRTLGSCTSRQCVTSVAIDAVTACVVIVVGLANGVTSTLGVLTRIDAVLVHARLRCRAVRIRSATDFVACNLSVSGVAFAACADRSVELYTAFCVQVA